MRLYYGNVAVTYFGRYRVFSLGQIHLPRQLQRRMRLHFQRMFLPIHNVNEVDRGLSIERITIESALNLSVSPRRLMIPLNGKPLANP